MCRFTMVRHSLSGMMAFLSTLSSELACWFLSRAQLELEVIALRHQLEILRNFLSAMTGHSVPSALAIAKSFRGQNTKPCSRHGQRRRNQLPVFSGWRWVHSASERVSTHQTTNIMRC
jgi:hypothetical protein